MRVCIICYYGKTPNYIASDLYKFIYSSYISALKFINYIIIFPRDNNTNIVKTIAKYRVFLFLDVYIERHCGVFTRGDLGDVSELFFFLFDPIYVITEDRIILSTFILPISLIVVITNRGPRL